MEYRKLLDFMSLTEKMKCNTRHSWTSSGREESVAEHTYSLCMMAWLMKDEFPDLNMDRIMMMCLFHDLGEAVTGDIPSFEKNDSHKESEHHAIEEIAGRLPDSHKKEFSQIMQEIEEGHTEEAKLFHALDKMDAVIQHNEADLSTWLPLEYDLQMVYGQEQAAVFPYTKALRDIVRADSAAKIEQKRGG